MKAFSLLSALSLLSGVAAYVGPLPRAPPPKDVRAKFMIFKDGVPDEFEIDVPTTGYFREDGREYGVLRARSSYPAPA